MISPASLRLPTRAQWDRDYLSPDTGRGLPEQETVMFKIENSINKGCKKMQEAFAKRGIADYCNAVEHGRRTVRTQVFIMFSGEVIKADSRIISDIAREVHG